MAELKDVRAGLVLGLGCERGADPADVISLAEDALARCGRSAADVVMVASIEARVGEPAIVAAARHFDAPLTFFPASVLEALTPRLVYPSDIVFAHTGCHGVAEAAALAGGGDAAGLIVPKLKSRQATVAIAESSQDVAVVGSQSESMSSQADSRVLVAPSPASQSRVFPSPPRGEGGPQGRMRGAGSEGAETPPHLPFGHLLPAGEKGEQAAMARNLESAPL